jgi:predicted O-linked N-acetylglucosamine transferase (SPINDLY family)
MLGRLFRGKPQPQAATGEDGALAQAVADHHAGRLAQAQAGYEAVLAREPRTFAALHMLGVLALQAGNAEDAALWIARALEVLPSDAGARNNLGEALRRLGRLPEAIESYRAAIAIAPDYADAHFNLGGVLRRLGRNAEAAQSYRTAVSLNPSFPEAHLRLGETLSQLGRPVQAIEALQAALALDGNLAKAHSSLGVALSAAGRLDEALASCQRAIALQPGLAIAHLNAGNVLREKGFLDEAIAAYRAAIECDPRLAEAFNNLGNALKHQGKSGEALQCYEHAVALAPEFAEPRLNAAKLLREDGRLADAAAAYRALLEGYPDLAEAHFDLGNALKGLGDIAGALECYRKALQIDPEFAEARWAFAMSQLPLVAEDEAAQSASREAFARELAALQDWCMAGGPEKAARAVGTQQPFYLAYQEGNHRDLLAAYGRLCAQLMGAWQRASNVGAPAPVTRAEIRVGIASAHVRDHSVWNAIVKGWLQKLDRNRFDVRLFHLGRASDVETALAKTLVTHYTYGKTDAVEWAQLILGHQLDVLIYPEIGMDPTTAKLASLRLAPVQAASWGHPITTGLPTIDCYLSADALEPAQAQDHYTERLVRLPGLGCWLEPPGAEPPLLEPATLGIRDGVPLLVCAGMPFKYTPRHDAMLAAIARRLGDCQFVFFTPQPAELMQRVRERMARAFAGAGLDFARLAVFVPLLSRSAFRGLLAQADVYLDTIGFSGFNTALQAIESGLPVAAWEGAYLRGRLASGILRRIGLDELVAREAAAFVETAARLAQDAAYWGDVRERMLAARARLYRDAAPVRALEKFLETAVSR